MVYCPVCGAENTEDAVYCIKCGAPLNGESRRVYYSRRRGEKDEKDEKDEKHEKDEEDEKFEKAEGERRTWGIIVGLLIIIAGAISLMDSWHVFWWATWDRLWPILIIVIGLFIIWGGLRARRRSPRP